MAEGPKLVAEALASGSVPEVIYLEPSGAGPAERDLAERGRAAGASVVDVEAGVLARVCDAVTPQPIAAIVPMVDVALEEVATRPSPMLICIGLQDPGNAGTVIRSALASGAGAVVFSAGAVDIYNPKAVRASAGAIFHQPLVAGLRPEFTLAELGRWGRRRLATVARGGPDYSTVDLASGAALVLGSESHGLPESLAGLLDGCLTIPMAATSESLNVAMAATVLCFEAARQRGASDAGANR